MRERGKPSLELRRRRIDAAREQAAADERAKGAAEANQIRADALAKQQAVLADGLAQAQSIRGEGDAKAAEIAAEAFGKDSPCAARAARTERIQSGRGKPGRPSG